MTAAQAVVLGASALVYGLAFPPWSVPAVAWVALAPLFAVLPRLGPLAGFGAGLLWGTVAIWAVGYWVPLALATYYQQPLWFGLLFSLAASVVFAGSYSAGFAASVCWLARRRPEAVGPVTIAALWVVWELARARLLTGDPWLLAGYALTATPTMMQAADLGGVYLLSFVVALVNAALAAAWADRRGRGVRVLWPAAVTVAATYAYGAWWLATPPARSPAHPIAVVQANTDVGWQWRTEYYGRGLNEYLRASYEAAEGRDVALLIWPESAVTFFLAHEPRYQRGIARVLGSVGADLIVGGPHHEGTDALEPQYFNSAFYVTADGRVQGRYDKTHLLPFAEYFPLRTIEFLRRRFERVRYFTPGAPGPPLETRIGKVATVICFEGIFPELVRAQMARGAEILVNLSNDAWLGRGAGPEQHLAMVTLRAVEHRTWLIRATTTGISAIVDPRGRVVARTGTFEPAVLHGTVAPTRRATLYQRIGDAFAYGCLAAVLLVALAARGSRARRAPAGRGVPAPTARNAPGCVSDAT